MEITMRLLRVETMIRLFRRVVRDAFQTTELRGWRGIYIPFLTATTSSHPTTQLFRPRSESMIGIIGSH